jgi:hypothetical protein
MLGVFLNCCILEARVERLPSTSSVRKAFARQSFWFVSGHDFHWKEPKVTRLDSH